MDLMHAFNSYCKVSNRFGKVFYEFLIFKNLLHGPLGERNNGKLSVISVSYGFHYHSAIKNKKTLL